MRILFSFVGGYGHFAPLAPLARACKARGHGVAFATSGAMLDVAAGEGFEVVALSDSPPKEPVRGPLLAPDRAREEQDFAQRFVLETGRYRAPRVSTAIEEWRADMVVCEETDFGAMAGAELAGVPHANLLVLAAGYLPRPEVIGKALAELRATLGLPPDPDLHMLRGHLVLSPFPTSFRHPQCPLPQGALSFRQPTATREEPLTWEGMRSGVPLVYFTLGTVFNLECGDLYVRALEGLRQLDANVVVTVGRHLETSELGEQPPHVHVATHIPQEQILPDCGLVVCHGGSGSVMGALSYGIPMLLLAMGADQLDNADRCVDLGVALALDPVAASPREVLAASRVVLEQPSFREAAVKIQREILALPDVDQACERIESLISAHP